jgi:two-component SAPR family response regulator
LRITRGSDGLRAYILNRHDQAQEQLLEWLSSDDRDYALDAFEVGAYGYLLCPVERDKLEKHLMMKKEM